MVARRPDEKQAEQKDPSPGAGREAVRPSDRASQTPSPISIHRFRSSLPGARMLQREKSGR